MNESHHSTHNSLHTHTPYHHHHLIHGHKRSVLEIPQGVQKMLDVLTDAREPVREVMLELMIGFTSHLWKTQEGKGVQQCLAFGEMFRQILELCQPCVVISKMIEDQEVDEKSKEDLLMTGLTILRHVTRGNSVTQMLLREQPGALDFLLQVAQKGTYWPGKMKVFKILMSCIGDCEVDEESQGQCHPLGYLYSHYIQLLFIFT